MTPTQTLKLLESALEVLSDHVDCVDHEGEVIVVVIPVGEGAETIARAIVEATEEPEEDAPCIFCNDSGMPQSGPPDLGDCPHCRRRG